MASTEARRLADSVNRVTFWTPSWIYPVCESSAPQTLSWLAVVPKDWPEEVFWEASEADSVRSEQGE
jgi:hypothetical protein